MARSREAEFRTNDSSTNRAHFKWQVNIAIIPLASGVTTSDATHASEHCEVYQWRIFVISSRTTSAALNLKLKLKLKLKCHCASNNNATIQFRCATRDILVAVLVLIHILTYVL